MKRYRRKRCDIVPVNNLREVRTRMDVGVDTLAEFLGVSSSTVIQAEISRTTAIGKRNWYKLADYFNVDPRVLEGVLPIPETFSKVSQK